MRFFFPTNLVKTTDILQNILTCGWCYKAFFGFPALMALNYKFGSLDFQGGKVWNREVGLGCDSVVEHLQGM
jgi:hypothetical protein